MKWVRCPCCGAAMRRNGRTTAGAQRWRCESCGASRTVSYDDGAARPGEFLAWLLSKATQADMPGQGRTLGRLAAEFWPVWSMPEPTGEIHRVLFLDGIWLDRDLAVPMAYDGERVVSWYMAESVFRQAKLSRFRHSDSSRSVTAFEPPRMSAWRTRYDSPRNWRSLPW